MLDVFCLGNEGLLRIMYLSYLKIFLILVTFERSFSETVFSASF
jgi:hypothetical protein